jgi:hypothetical protein
MKQSRQSWRMKFSLSFEATAAEASQDVEFDDFYEVVVVPVQSQDDASQVRLPSLCSLDL